MRKLILFALITVGLLQACHKDDENTGMAPRFEINAAKSSVDGNLIMGIAVTGANTFTLVTKNSPAGNPVTISSDTINGLYIKSSSATIANDSVKVPMSGTPVIDGVFNLTVKVNMGGTIYVCTREFYVDLPNVTAITSSLPADTTVKDVVDSAKLNFTIDPYTTVFNIAVPAHLTAQITSTSRTNRVLTLYADKQFLTGDVVITSTFRNVTPLVNTIHVNTFSGGDGTAAKPFEIADTARLSKIQLAPDKNFLLVADVNSPKSTLAATTLTGSLDGNGKKITGYVLNSTADNAGFFAAIGASGSVKNIIFNNHTVTGKDNTGGVAAVNNGSISNVTVAGTITGANNVSAIAGNNQGSISSCDVSNANVVGVNNIATLAGTTGSGASQTGNVILNVPAAFPKEIFGVTSAQTVPFAFTPVSGTITVKSSPAGVTASATGQNVTVSAGAGFISGNMQLTLTAGKLSTTKDVMLYSKTAGAVFDGGDGTTANPYIISSEAAFDSIINAPSKYYQLAADINLTKPWVTIPAFSGSLDGKGFKVNGLVINAVTAVSGLTGINTGTIKNIRFLNVSCTTTSNTFGVIAGRQNGGVLQNVMISGTLTSTATGDTIGGLAGVLTNGGKITQCYAKLTMTAACGMVGGLVGCLTTTATASEISNSTTAGSIEITAAKSRIGGILGRGAGTVVSGGVIKNCASSMDIKATGTASTGANGFGGIFGADQSAGIVPIDQCMFTGTVAAGFSVGGIAGVGSNITNCILNGQGAALTNSTLLSTGVPSVGSVGGIAGTGKNLLQYCIVKNATFRGSAAATFPLGGIASTYQNNGSVSNAVVINTSIDGGANSTRVTGMPSGSTPAGSTGTHSNNYVGPNVTTPNRVTPFVDDAAGVDGMLQATMPFSFFTGIGFSAAIWKTDTDGYPTLINAGYNGGYPIP
ncbi:MAG: hypothetical protein QM731_01975 [Chitinophagaceae bacterium]